MLSRRSCERGAIIGPIHLLSLCHARFAKYARFAICQSVLLYYYYAKRILVTLSKDSLFPAPRGMISEVLSCITDASWPLHCSHRTARARPFISSLCSPTQLLLNGRDVFQSGPFGKDSRGCPPQAIKCASSWVDERIVSLDR